ncbi:MAG TPA: CoA transferase [Candidatus Acidoferrales bacterium]|nr:CoA transferase [Candidatus Acidoferrales bacterium]
MNGALTGIRVVEMASYVTGPFAGVLLADLGADVIKVEEPGKGDPFRGWGDKLYAANFRSLNRNKRSIALDIRNSEGKEILLKLLATADVFIENFRPGTLDKRGLGYEQIRKLNPRIVYCSISGFGPRGPYKDLPGYDTVGQAMSGLLSLLTDPGEPKGMGISFSDHLTGLYACYGILGALVNRAVTGQGQRVETSLLRASVAFIAENATRYFEDGEVPRRAHRTHHAGVFAFEDRAGKAFVLHLSSPDKFWRGLFEVVGKAEWASDPRFADRKARIENYETLSRAMKEIFRQGDRDDWIRRLREKDVPCAPLNTLDEVFEDPQVREYGFPLEVTHPEMGKVRLVGSAIDMSRTPPKIEKAPPMLGEHTEGILRELGFEPAAIAALKKDGVVA